MFSFCDLRCSVGTQLSHAPFTHFLSLCEKQLNVCFNFFYDYSLGLFPVTRLDLSPFLFRSLHFFFNYILHAQRMYIKWNALILCPKKSVRFSIIIVKHFIEFKTRLHLVIIWTVYSLIEKWSVSLKSLHYNLVGNLRTVYKNKLPVICFKWTLEFNLVKKIRV